LAAVDGFVDAPVGIRRPFRPAGGDVDDVRIFRMDDDPGDGPRPGQAAVRPGPPGVGGAVDAHAGLGRTENVRLAGADPDDILVGRSQGHVADGRGRSLLEHGSPGRPFIVGFPEAAGSGGDIHRVGLSLGRRDGHVDAAAADVLRPEELPCQILEFRFALHLHMLIIGLKAEGRVGVGDPDRLFRLLGEEEEG